MEKVKKPRRLSKKVTQQVKDLAVLKWETIVEHGGGQLSEWYLPKEVQDLKFNCSLCHVFINNMFDNCNGCPLDFIKSNQPVNGCQKKGHPFLKWADTRRGGKNELFYAKKILKLLKDLKVEE
jgi:hypothetical protein